VNEVIKDDDKTLILLSSLPDEKYETFVLTLINGKSSLNYNNVSTALANYEVRRKDNESSCSTMLEALTVKGIGLNHRKGKRDIGKSKTDNRKLRKNQYAFCKKGH